MGYQFVGFFAKPRIDAPEDLPANATWRLINAPFAGSGVLLPDLFGRVVTPEAVEALAVRLRFHDATDWLFIIYECFGGLDFVFGMGRRGDRHFGPVEESNLENVESAYMGLMSEFGVRPEDALSFPPFERGFWGEQ